MIDAVGSQQNKCHVTLTIGKKDKETHSGDCDKIIEELSLEYLGEKSNVYHEMRALVSKGNSENPVETFLGPIFPPHKVYKGETSVENMRFFLKCLNQHNGNSNDLTRQFCMDQFDMKLEAPAQNEPTLTEKFSRING